MVGLESAPKLRSAPAEEVTLKIDGMTCVSRVEKALARLPGVATALVSLITEEARITGVAAAVDLPRLVATVEAAGYEARPKSSDAAGEDDSAARARRDGIVFLASATLTLPLLLPMVASVFGSGLKLPPWLQLMLATPVKFGAGASFYRNGFKKLRHGVVNMDLLVVLGTTARVYWCQRAMPIM